MRLPSLSRCHSVTLAVLALAPCTGCPQALPPNSQHSSPNLPAAVAIRVIVVGDSPLARTMEREWGARGEEEVAIKELSAQELLAAKRLSTDVIVAPAELLGELVEADKLLPMPDATLIGKELERDALFPRLRSDCGTWGKRTYGLPLGAPTLQLLYRADLFANMNLNPPRTWAEYAALLPQLASAREVDGWQATAEPLAPGWAGKLLLARAASHLPLEAPGFSLIELSTLAPKITGAPWERALTELATAAQGRADRWALTPDQARAELLAGRCAMALTWPCGVRTNDAETPSELPEIRIAPLPGNGERQVAFGGMAGYLAFAAKDCRRPSSAFKFITWLTNEGADRVSPQCSQGSPTRTTQASLAGKWVDAGLSDALGREYFALLEADHSRPLQLAALRLPDQARLLNALEEAVSKAVKGEAAPAEALSQAAATWQGIIAEQNAEKFRAATRRSLNLSQ